MTRVRGSKLRTQRQTVIGDEEFEAAIRRASEGKTEFLRLRARAVLCVFRLTGKRRGEVAMLPLQNFTIDDKRKYLNVTFILEKKRKKTALSKTATKSIPLDDPLVKDILQYLKYLKNLNTIPLYFLPPLKNVFGNSVILDKHHISGRQLFNIVRGTSQAIWPHLFRETVASDIVKQDSTIIAAFKVQQRLDLENFQTGFNYLRRFANDVIKREIKQLEAEPD